MFDQPGASFNPTLGNALLVLLASKLPVLNEDYEADDHWSQLWRWNDHPARTKAEALALIDAALAEVTK